MIALFDELDVWIKLGLYSRSKIIEMMNSLNMEYNANK